MALAPELDDRELIPGQEAKGRLQERALAGTDAVGAYFGLEEADLAGFTPGEGVEEARQLPAVGCPQLLEYRGCPWRCAGRAQGAEAGGREPGSPQLTGS